MKSGLVQMSIPLSQLVPSQRNPRKVKPSKEAHHRLVALIRSQGLLQPLVVRKSESQAKRFEVVAGERRLRALREIHGKDDVKIPCVVRDVDLATADAMSLGENFGREAMHPLDEAEAFSKLAMSDGKDAAAIGAEFGVADRYVKQRIKLATLINPVKAAFREGKIDTATAEAFAAVPEDRQLEVWKEMGGNPRHAEHVRNVIAHAWIDGADAIFDLSTLPPGAVSQDLFSDRILVERKAFMEAQAKALEEQRKALLEEGWAEVVVGRREDLQDRVYSMAPAEREFDEKTRQKLKNIAEERDNLRKAADKLGEGDEAKLERLQERYEALEDQEQKVIADAPEFWLEETKAVGTVFLTLSPDGSVEREHRLVRRKQADESRGNGSTVGGEDKPKPPTSDDLSDRQRAAAYIHHVLAVREALLKNTAARKRILAILLHDRIPSEAIALRHEANAITVNANTEGFQSVVFDRLRDARAKVDPFSGKHYVEDTQAYDALTELPSAKLDALIDQLTVDLVTAHLQRETKLVQHLASELKVNIRDCWHPDAAWLESFKKIQLAHLIVALKGRVAAPSPDSKKSELVTLVAKLFADAAEGKLEDKQLAERVNNWLPSNLRPPKEKSSSKK